MCDVNAFENSITALVTFATLTWSGAFVLLSMGKIHKREQFENELKITKQNQLPTSTSDSRSLPSYRNYHSLRY